MAQMAQIAQRSTSNDRPDAARVARTRRARPADPERRSPRAIAVLRRRCWRALAALVAPLLVASPSFAADGEPSRAANEGCTWETMTDAKVGLEAWVQRCDFGFRKIDFLFTGSSLALRYSDGGAPDRVIDVFALDGTESPEAGVKRIFAAHTAKAVAERCAIAPFTASKAPAGVQRFTFVPDAAYAKELKAKQSPDEVPEPPCGDFGDAPDGVRYFETQPGSPVRKVLFVRVGQEAPLFDEQTLRLVPAT